VFEAAFVHAARIHEQGDKLERPFSKVSLNYLCKPFSEDILSRKRAGGNQPFFMFLYAR
jgi:hypothetical protein